MTPETEAIEEAHCVAWLKRNLPAGRALLNQPTSRLAFRCPDCGRKGDDCWGLTFARDLPPPRRESERYCMDCLWVLAEKHLTPLEDVTNG